jgi:hypothetical protein
MKKNASKILTLLIAMFFIENLIGKPSVHMMKPIKVISTKREVMKILSARCRQNSITIRKIKKCKDLTSKKNAISQQIQDTLYLEGKILFEAKKIVNVSINKKKDIALISYSGADTPYLNADDDNDDYKNGHLKVSYGQLWVITNGLKKRLSAKDQHVERTCISNDGKLVACIIYSINKEGYAFNPKFTVINTDSKKVVIDWTIGIDSVKRPIFWEGNKVLAILSTHGHDVGDMKIEYIKIDSQVPSL